MTASSTSLEQRINEDNYSIFFPNGATYNYAMNRYCLNGDWIELTAIDRKLLHCLAMNAEKIVPNQTILRRVWGHGHEYMNYIPVYISNLRKKIDRECIQNEHGIGYMLTGVTIVNNNSAETLFTIIRFSEHKWYDTEERALKYYGISVELAKKESEILCFLAENLDKIVSRKNILQNVWGQEYTDDTQYLWTYFHRLRDKIADINQNHIKTIWGIGYMLTNVTLE